uniref:Na/Pi cotransporter n=1 Tax=Steinernema glaseri TaxID=37863 RepID=A0A1I7ZGU3_9BILA
LIGGRGLGNVINNSSLIQNPISAAIIGMVVTLILQSSSTLMSVMVGMVAGNLITVHNAIPVMMGAEMGSSIMNALISLTQSGDPQQFRRAFAAATMNDVYNVCCVFTILPLEVAFGE